MKPILHEGNKLSKRQEIENWITKHYEVRYNTVKYTAEFRERGKGGYFEELTDRDMNTMIRRMDVLDGLTVNGNLLYSILNSDFATPYNPITEYFNELKFDIKNDGGMSEMERLAGCVVLKNTKYTDTWFKIFKSWMVASVANSLTPFGCQNQMCLVLIGGQGTYKTTFLNYLCPPKLNEYIYSSSLDLKSKDTWIMLGQNFIINIDDQLENLFKQDSETMKTLIGSKENKRRLPHAKFVQNIPRIANFCGSINHKEFLRDQTGNRRFLPFEVKSIDINFAKEYVNIDLVWYEAYQLFKSGFKYWFSTDELNELFQSFDDFYVVTPEEELLLTYFELRNLEEKQEGIFLKLTATEIETELSKETGNRRLSARTIGQIMKKRGCAESTRSGGSRCYLVRKKDAFEIERERGQNMELKAAF